MTQSLRKGREGEMMIKAFLVDDEEHALNILEIFLGQIGGIEVIGRSNNGFDAISQLGTLRPDILFLDIEMPEMSGLELADIIYGSNGELPIIFVTAYDQYAIAAFEQGAMDYILKPLEIERLAKAIARVDRRANLSGTGELEEGASEELSTADLPRFTIQMLGTFYAGARGEPSMKWRISKEKEMLSYLALKGEGRVHRDLIIEDLWPDETYHKAKIYMHTCVSLLRKSFKKLGFDGVVKYENERYFLDLERIDIDVLRYKQLIKNLKNSAYAEPAKIEEALAVYQGMMFKDEDYVWAEQEIELLEKSAVEWQITLAKTYLGLQEYEKAVKTAELIMAYSPYFEEAYRLGMEGYQKLGRNDQVLLVYQKLCLKLEELDIKPSAMTKVLYDEIFLGA
ncbi:response regulator [Paenibacillaceae bacterium]|nr:response regulator [Paenibacillaceae bacterium]